MQFSIQAKVQKAVKCRVICICKVDDIHRKIQAEDKAKICLVCTYLSTVKLQPLLTLYMLALDSLQPTNYSKCCRVFVCSCWL